jgi:hypothetical protein
MTDRSKTKEALLNEFIGTAVALGTAATLGGLVYSGQQKGTGFRYRIGERLKSLPSYISREIQKDTLSKINKRHADYHSQIANKYDLAPQQYASVLNQHQETSSRFTDRERLISDIKPHIEHALNKAMPTLRGATPPIDPTKELYTKYVPRAANIPEIQGKTVAEVAALHQTQYKDPRTGQPVLDPQGNPYTIGDAIHPTKLEQLDAVNPSAADFRKRIQSNIFATQLPILDKISKNIQSTTPPRISKAQADVIAQRQQLKQERDALPLVTEPGITNTERVKRALHKGFRATFDRLRTAV